MEVLFTPLGDVQYITMCPALLMPITSVNTEPGTLIVLYFPPLNRNPCTPLLSMKTPTISPLSLIPLAIEKVAPAGPGTSVNLPFLYKNPRGVPGVGSYEPTTMIGPLGFKLLAWVQVPLGSLSLVSFFPSRMKL